MKNIYEEVHPFFRSAVPPSIPPTIHPPALPPVTLGHGWPQPEGEFAGFWSTRPTNPTDLSKFIPQDLASDSLVQKSPELAKIYIKLKTNFSILCTGRLAVERTFSMHSEIKYNSLFFTRRRRCTENQLSTFIFFYWGCPMTPHPQVFHF